MDRTDETIQLQQKLARVQSLLEASRTVHSTDSLDDVLSNVVELAAKELEAESAFLIPGSGSDIRSRFYGRAREDWKLWTECDSGSGYSSVSLPGEGRQSLARLVVYRPKPLTLEEHDFLEGLALQSALAVNKARHDQRSAEWERVQRDLEAARVIQHSLQPKAPPALQGYAIDFRYTPCFEVGGDYVDIVSLEDGRLVAVVADVAGKGFASALISMSFRTSFRAMCRLGLPLHEIAARLNALHWQEGVEARLRYVTAILVSLDLGTHTLQAVNAGHCPGLLARAGRVIRIEASGPPLGILPDSTYLTETYLLGDRSELLLYTDGLTEAFRGHEDFGVDRLQEHMLSAPRSSVLDDIWAAIGCFADGAAQADDMTALLLRRSSDGAAYEQ